MLDKKPKRGEVTLARAVALRRTAGQPHEDAEALQGRNGLQRPRRRREVLQRQGSPVLTAPQQWKAMDFVFDGGALAAQRTRRPGASRHESVLSPARRLQS